jgi:hypothetical protein
MGLASGGKAAFSPTELPIKIPDGPMVWRPEKSIKLLRYNVSKASSNLFSHVLACLTVSELTSQALGKSVVRRESRKW